MKVAGGGMGKNRVLNRRRFNLDSKDHEMLPKIIDNSDAYSFMASHNGGLAIGFATAEAFARGGAIEMLWAQNVPDERTLLAMQRWVAVRRHLWESWGQLAEAIGRSAFIDHMAKLLTDEPIGEVMGTTIHRAEDDDHAIILGEILSTRLGIQTEELYCHRFGSPQLRTRFFDWLHTGDNHRASEELVQIAFNLGTDAVANALDTIAALPDQPAAVAAVRRKSSAKRGGAV